MGKQQFNCKEDYVEYYMKMEINYIYVITLLCLSVVPLTLNYHLTSILLNDPSSLMFNKGDVITSDNYELNIEDFYILRDDAVFIINLVMLVLGSGYAAFCLIIALVLGQLIMLCSKREQKIHRLYLGARYDQMRIDQKVTEDDGIIC
jgi:hypothetical protein